MSCKNCKSTKLIKRVKIGEQPLSGFFHKKIKKITKIFIRFISM